MGVTPDLALMAATGGLIQLQFLRQAFAVENECAHRGSKENGGHFHTGARLRLNQRA